MYLQISLAYLHIGNLHIIEYLRALMKTKFYSLQHTVSAVIMMLMLAWLTVSIPFVYQSQQAAIEQTSKQSSQSDKDDNNPFTNTTEEKAPSNTTINEEFLHHHEELTHPSADILTHYNDHTFSVYVAFHGELISPPPEL